MKIIDISWPLTPNLTGYKDKKEYEVFARKTFTQDGVRESGITLGAHAGTHVDAPSHFIDSGETIDQVALSTLIGPCIVLDIDRSVTCITRDILMQHSIPEKTIVLLKTSNSQLHQDAPFNKDFIYLERSGAEHLAEKQVSAVGIDYLGIERNQKAHDTHVILFNAGITIIEGLRLKDVLSGCKYFLYCLPLALQGLEAAPARAILIEQ